MLGVRAFQGGAGARIKALRMLSHPRQPKGPNEMRKMKHHAPVDPGCPISGTQSRICISKRTSMSRDFLFVFESTNMKIRKSERCMKVTTHHSFPCYLNDKTNYSPGGIKIRSKI